MKKRVYIEKVLKKMNRRGESTGNIDQQLLENVMYIILLAGFIVTAVIFMNLQSNYAGLSAQIYAKQIALTIDKIKPGTIITMDISELFRITRKNKFNPDYLVKINNTDNKVKVNLIMGKSYEYTFFNSADISWNINKKDETLYLEAIKK